MRTTRDRLGPASEPRFGAQIVVVVALLLFVLMGAVGGGGDHAEPDTAARHAVTLIDAASIHLHAGGGTLCHGTVGCTASAILPASDMPLLASVTPPLVPLATTIPLGRLVTPVPKPPIV